MAYGVINLHNDIETDNDKIERYHRTIKNVVNLDKFYCAQKHIAAPKTFVDRYNNNRYHESLNNLTPSDVYYGRGNLILKKKKRNKKTNTFTTERLNI
ncbi:MAG: integrase core domain-containing protein [Sphingobacterium sp.]